MANINYSTAQTGSSRMKAMEPGQQAFQDGTLWKILILTALSYLVWSDKITIVYNAGQTRSERTGESGGKATRASLDLFGQEQNKPAEKRAAIVLPKGSFNNVTHAIDPGYAERYATDEAAWEKSRRRCEDYIAYYAPIAITEMKKYGIPASVTLAQGLLESNAGESRLARNSNNHFGIKCFSKRCKKGHCVNFTDDSHKDFFVKYNNIWGSYRAHSQFLKSSKRYAHLFKLAPDNYKAWAKGLSKAGYATDKKYGEKLILIIENLGLHRFDEV